LIFGNDSGLVSERAATFAKAAVGRDADPLSLVRLDSSEISADPNRLADEAYEIPLFGGTRCITVHASGNWSLAPVEALIASPPQDAWIVVTAGELKKTAALRKLFAGAANAAAIACYADDARALDGLIDQEVRAAGLTIADDARATLKELVGGDRLASRSEIAKLCLYAAGSGEITVDDVRAVVGDASAFAIDEAVDAAALGDAEGFARLYRRLLAAGTGDFAVAGAALRHFDMLHRARAAVDGGIPADRALGPQIFFKRKPLVTRQLQMWSLPRIERVLAILNRAVVDSRLKSAISAEVVGQAMLSVAAIASSTRRRAA
ncbi:MAG: DNA polymerase III subunit delta, partial [Bauldia sp.]|nr:DNA polymerase III subunit delta [Bauldia sp.]